MTQVKRVVHGAELGTSVRLAAVPVGGTRVGA